MKNKILLMSAALVGLALITGLVNTLFVSEYPLHGNLDAASLKLIVGSIGLFFIGFAYPKEIK